MKDKGISYPELIPAGPKLNFKQTKKEADAPVERHRLPEKEKRKTYVKRKKKSKVNKGSSALLESLMGFVFVALLGGGLIYHRVTGQTLLSVYALNMVGLSIVLGFYVVMIIESFSHDLMQGVLCLFVPPYVFIYGLFFSDAGPLRGFTLGVLVFLGAEMHFTPDTSLALKGRDQVTGWVEGGQRLLSGERRDAGF